MGFMKDFVKKHKRKIIVTSLVAVGTYAIGKYLKWKYEEWENEKAEEFALLAKKKYHFESNQKTCTITFLSFLPDIRNTIAEKLNTESLLDVLKLKPSNKLEIWEQLKIISLSQMVCSVVSNVILLVLLKSHLNIMGGYMIVNSQEDGKSVEQGEEMNECQLSYMANIRFFMENQLLILIEDCTKIVQDLLNDISLKEKLSHSKLRKITSEVINRLKNLHKSDKEISEKHGFCKYMIDKKWMEVEHCDEIYQKMTSETIDILEGKDCCLVIDQCILAGVNYIFESLRDCFCGSEDPEAIVSIQECAKASYYKQIDLPLAKIIPLLCFQLNEIFKEESNEFLDILFAQKHLRQWTSNIYEAFSKKY